jgi:hypothetical protein
MELELSDAERNALARFLVRGRRRSLPSLPRLAPRK